MNPIGEPADTTTIYLGLGSNLGDRARALHEARGRLAPHVTIARVSPVYETEPVGRTEQPMFLNQVVEARTGLSASAVVDLALAVERAMGRRRDGAATAGAGGPRIIDIDLLLYGSAIVDLPGVQVPHPRLGERAFVLVPLADIAPDLIHPALGVSVSTLLARLSGRARRGVRVT